MFTCAAYKPVTGKDYASGERGCGYGLRPTRLNRRFFLPCDRYIWSVGKSNICLHTNFGICSTVIL